MQAYVRECLRDRPAFLIKDAGGEDLSGNGRHAWKVGTSYNFTPGPAGLINVGGNGGVSTTPNNALQNSYDTRGTQSTVECWFKSNVGASQIVLMGTWWTGTEYSCDLGIGTQPGAGGGTGSVWHGMHEGGVYIGMRSNANYCDLQWHHLVGGYQQAGGSVATTDFGLFVDGVLITSVATHVVGSYGSAGQTGSQGYRMMHGVPDNNTACCMFAWYPTWIGAERVGAHYQAGLLGLGGELTRSRSRLGR